MLRSPFVGSEAPTSQPLGTTPGRAAVSIFLGIFLFMASQWIPSILSFFLSFFFLSFFLVLFPSFILFCECLDV